jgi:hypothetical protein
VRRCAREGGSSLGCRRGWRGRRGTQGGGGALVSDGGVGEGSEKAGDRGTLGGIVEADEDGS